MNPWLPFVAGLIAASPALAQTQSVVIDTADSVEAPGGANLRGLDRINGRIRDFEIAPGETTKFERLFVTLSECRYPSGAVEAEAFGYLTIRDERGIGPGVRGMDVRVEPCPLGPRPPALRRLGAQLQNLIDRQVVRHRQKIRLAFQRRVERQMIILS